MAETIKNIPRHYPDGGPLYWMWEETGALKEAVAAYLERQEVTPLFLDYLNYWIDAPVWKRNPQFNAADRLELQTLIDRSKELKTAEDVNNWMHDAVEFGIDLL